MTNTAVELKIAYIGGGSRGWAHVLMGDLATCPDLSGQVLLCDIDYASAQLNEALGNWLQTQPGVRSYWRYQAVERLEQALAGADFVFISIQPGPLEMMAHEIAVAEKYGLFFPVGDTTGAPGLMRGLRSAITYAGFAQAIAEHCPTAWVVNYSNPMTICTRTLTRVAPGLKVFGCCHEVFGAQGILAELAKQYLGLDQAPEELFRWGIIRTPMSYRFARWQQGPQIARDYLEGRQRWEVRPSGEDMVRQLRALLGFEDLITNVNTANAGQVANLPLGAVVETNARFSRDLVQPLAAGALALGVHALVARHVADQEMIVQAALERDAELAFQAFFNDPTTNLPIDRAWLLFQEIGLPWDPA